MSDLPDDAATFGSSHKPQPDAYGQAAYLLVESLLHGLIEQRLLTNEAVIAIVETALEVKAEVADELGDSQATMAQSLAMLNGMVTSLRTDKKGLTSITS